MKRFLLAVASGILLAAPCVARAAMTPMASSTYGAGPHGYDWAIGTWSCRNAMPSPMGGPAKQMLTVTRANGVLMYHDIGTNFDQTWYNVYVPGTKSWTSPFVVSDGTYGTEFDLADRQKDRVDRDRLLTLGKEHAGARYRRDRQRQVCRLRRIPVRRQLENAIQRNVYQNLAAPYETALLNILNVHLVDRAVERERSPIVII